MSMTIGKRILRLIDPEGEKQRMQMRHLRCVAEANAEDLTRTIIVSHDKLIKHASIEKGDK
jgi:hypothetical protein